MPWRCLSRPKSETIKAGSGRPERSLAGQKRTSHAQRWQAALDSLAATQPSTSTCVRFAVNLTSRDYFVAPTYVRKAR